MREAIRCCIACILPCGALDVVRIVHAGGRVEEISHAVRAADVMRAHPKHVLRKPPSTSLEECAAAAEAVVLPPGAELKKGEIYFLVPAPADHQARAGIKCQAAAVRGTGGTRKRRKKRGEAVGVTDTAELLLGNDRYLTEILSEKVSTSQQKDRSRGRVGVWRPHLESIDEVSPATTMS